MQIPLRFVVTLASVLANCCLLLPQALACSPPLLCKPLTPIAAGAQLPAVAQAIPLWLPTPMQSPYLPIVPQLLDAVGQPVSFEMLDDTLPGWKLLRPLKGFTDGATYALRLPQFCLDANGVVLPPDELTFTTASKTEVPTHVGKLVLGVTPPAMVSVGTAAGSCTVPILAARGTVALDADASLEPWYRLARAELWIDGQVWDRSLYGALPLSTHPPDPNAFGRSTGSFFVPCGDVPKYADAGLAPGPHHVDLRVHVAGQWQEAPYLFGDVTLTCAAPPEGDRASTQDAQDTDATGAVAECGVGPEDADNRDKGCSAGTHRHRSAWFLGIAGACLVLARRRSHSV